MDAKEVRKKMQEFLRGKEETVKVKKKVVKVPEKKEKHAQYFEGEIQLRNVNKEIINYVLKRVDSENERIPSVKEHKNDSIDFKISSKKLAHKIGQELKKKFGGEVKESERLFSQNRQTGKEIFRLNVYFEKFEIDINDIVEYKNKAYRIRGFDNNKAKVESLNDKKRTQIDPKKVNKLKIYKKQIIQDKPKKYVLNEDYENTEIINSNKNVGENVKCVFVDGNAFEI